ncbi:MAG: RluA family pseudouridine synthase [Treponema sp.]
MKNIDVIYENKEILIVNKPAGVAVQGGADVAHPLDKELPQKLGYPIYLVHRLDMDTAGLMIIAKSPTAAAKWTKLIAEKSVQREYTAVCAGIFKKKSGTLTEDIFQHGIRKSAVTHYSVLRSFEFSCSGENIPVSIVSLRLETGRMHQIRIHLAKENCPIIGDVKYGDFPLNKKLKKCAGVKRLFLVANKLTVPIEGKRESFEIPFPEHIEKFIDLVYEK